MGRTGMVLGNAGTCRGVCERLPHGRKTAMRRWATRRALTRARPTRRITAVARGAAASAGGDHTDIRVLSLYAFSAFEQQRWRGGSGWGDDAEVTAGG